jgi:Putative metallopeptidase
MQSRPLRHILLLLAFALLFAVEPVFAQIAPSEGDQLQARIEAAARAHAGDERYKGLSPKDRLALAEFVAGNTLFALLHEMGHAVVAEMGLPVLGKEEDAADAFAATRLISVASGFSDRVLAEAAKGWFMTNRRDKKEGDPVPPYDAHGLDLVRAYQIVCFMVGSNEHKFANLADETKLPKDRQESCTRDYNKAASSWGLALKAHLRAPDQPKTKIDVVYGDATGNLEGFAQAARSIMLLEPLAQHAADLFVWPAPFTIQMQSCGAPNAGWDPPSRTLTMCYELAEDFAELYRSYGVARADRR